MAALSKICDEEKVGCNFLERLERTIKELQKRKIQYIHTIFMKTLPITEFSRPTYISLALTFIKFVPLKFFFISFYKLLINFD